MRSGRVPVDAASGENPGLVVPARCRVAVVVPVVVPLHRSPALTWIGRQGALWLFGASAIAIAAVWIGEGALGVIAPGDHYAYPALLGCFGLAAVLAWRRADHVLLGQRIAVLAVHAHLVFSAWMVALSAL